MNQEPTSTPVTESESSAQESTPPLISRRELRFAAFAVTLLVLIYLVFGSADWTVAGELILQATPAGMVAIVHIPETEIALVTVGQIAQIRLRAYPGTDIVGQVFNIEGKALPADEDARVVTVPVTLVVNPPEGVMLRDGFTGAAHIRVARDRVGLVLWGRLSRILLQRF